MRVNTNPKENFTIGNDVYTIETYHVPNLYLQ